MPALLRLYDRLTRHGWRIPLLATATSFVVGWLLIAIFEAPGAPIKSPWNFWWYYIVSGTSTGYGDLSPETTGGRIGGAIIIVVGLTAGLTLLLYFSQFLERRRRLRMTGLAQHHVRDHVVLVGHRPDRVDRFVTELRAHPDFAKVPVIVGCYPGQLDGENPNPASYDVVVWNDTARERACLQHARAIVVDADSDETSAFTMMRIVTWLRQQGVQDLPHLVVALDDAGSFKAISDDLECLESRIETVVATDTALVADAVHNPGISHVYGDLASKVGDGASLYRVNIPLGMPHRFSWNQLALHLMKEGITLLGLAASHRPDANTQLLPNPQALIGAGQSLILVASERPNIQWNQIA